MLDIAKIEAAAAFWLTSTSAIVRQSCLKLIKLCVQLNQYQPKHSQLPYSDTIDSGASSDTNESNSVDDNQTPASTSKMSGVRLQTIIDSVTQDFDTLTTSVLPKEIRQSSSTINGDVLIDSVYECASQETNNGQLQWTMCLGKILQRSVRQNCTFLGYAYEHAKTHADNLLKQIRNNESEGYMIGIWTNFVLFVTVSVALIEPIPGNAEDLFHAIIPLIQSDDAEIQFMGSLSLGKIECSMILTLMKCLETIQHSVFSAKKKPKHCLRLLQNLAYIFRLLAEDVDKSTVFSSEMIRERMISFIEKSMKFMEEYRANIRPDCLVTRIHFCVIVRNIVEKWPQSDSIDPISCRFRKKLFDFMIPWCSNSSANFASQNDSASSLTLSREDEKQFAAMSAIVALLRGPSFEDVSSLRDGKVFAWIRNIVTSSNKSISLMGSIALQSYLSWTSENFDEFVEECYNENHIVSKTFFIVLADVWLKEKFIIPKQVLFHLAIYKMGDNSMHVRSAALKIGREIPCLFTPEINTKPLRFAISSKLSESYSQAQKELSAQLASAYPNLSAAFIKEFGDKIQCIDVSQIDAMFQYMYPWFANIELNNDTQFVLDILFKATVDFQDQHADSVQKVWTAMTTQPGNINKIVDYILYRCQYEHQFAKHIVLEACKRIILYCSRAQRFETVQHLISIMSYHALGQQYSKKVLQNTATEKLCQSDTIKQFLLVHEAETKTDDNLSPSCNSNDVMSSLSYETYENGYDASEADSCAWNEIAVKLWCYWITQKYMKFYIVFLFCFLIRNTE